MSYIGNTPTQQGFSPAIDYFSGTGSQTAFVCSRPIASTAQVTVVVNNVTQNPSTAFTVSGNTITFTGAPSLGTNNIYVSYTSSITQVIQPSQGTVGTSQLIDASVTTAKLSASTGSGAVALASLPVFTTTLGVGGATPSGSGAGITFPATQSASTDANTLDDYEEGTFSPTVGSLSTDFTMSESYGNYVKVGSLVTVTIIVSWGGRNGASSSDFVKVKNLPFTSWNDSSRNRMQGMIGSYPPMAASTWYSLNLYEGAGTNYCGLEGRNGLNGNSTNITVGNLTDNGSFRAEMTYRTAS